MTTTAIATVVLLAVGLLSSGGAAQGGEPSEVRTDAAGVALVEPVRVLDTRSVSGQLGAVTVPIAGVGGVPE